jgi:hypothetical protein
LGVQEGAGSRVEVEQSVSRASEVSRGASSERQQQGYAHARAWRAVEGHLHRASNAQQRLTRLHTTTGSAHSHTHNTHARAQSFSQHPLKTDRGRGSRRHCVLAHFGSYLVTPVTNDTQGLHGYFAFSQTRVNEQRSIARSGAKAMHTGTDTASSSASF